MTRKITLACLALCICLGLCGCGDTAEPVQVEEAIIFAANGEAETAKDTETLTIVLQSGETALLDKLPMLTSADFSGSDCVDEIYAWSLKHPEVELVYTVTLPDGTVLDNSDRSADLSKMSGSDIRLAAEKLKCLPQLKVIELGRERDNLDWDDIGVLQQACPEAKCKFIFTLYGKEIDLQNTQLNLSHIPVEDNGYALRQAMAHMPQLTYLDMDSCGVSNEDMAAIRDDFPNVKVVWRIWFGSNLNYSVRTDVERILASKSSVGGFVYGEYAEPLKYCTEVKYLDLGHNPLMTDISFVSYMPKLEVAILAMGGWSDASPLANCTELEYLEMQTTECTDLSPLSGLTKLRHLNVACIPGLTDISPLYSLTELERLWLGSYNQVTWEQVDEMQKAAPNCEINTSVFDDPTGEGWRYKGMTMDYRYFVLRRQFDNYENKVFSFTWNDPLY